MPWHSTTDIRFIVHRLQEKFYATNKTLYLAFVDLKKGIRSCTQTCHLVAFSQTRHRWVVGAAHTEHVWLQPERRVQCESGRSSRFLLEPPTVHHGCGSPVPGVSYRMSLGKPVSRWPGHYHWNHWRNCKRSWSSGRPTWKERDKTKVLISVPGLDVL